jgi:predicted nucleic acid-binding protein
VIVADTSALIAFLLRMQGADAIRARLFDSGLALQVPHLLDVEVAQVIRRHAAAGKIGPGQIGPGQGRELLEDFAGLPLQRHAHDWLLPRVWELRHNLSAYDAVYVALAEALDAPLITRDERLAAAPGHHAKIELV